MKQTDERDGLLLRNGVSLMVPFVLITMCFALWGFANDSTAPMVKAFSKIFRMSVTEGALVPMAFYLGYFAMAFPAALFIQRFSFKSGVMLGLALMGLGALLFIPAKMMGYYYPFLLAYFIMTCGLSFLETSCNPYIYCMGSEQTATRRLNLAQAFNPIGALAGMFVAMQWVQVRMNPLSTEERMKLNDMQLQVVRDHDLSVLIGPYIFLASAAVILLVLIWLTRMPKGADTPTSKDVRTAMEELWQLRSYREGVIAQFFYVGAQVTCWTFIIQYGTHIFMSEGMPEKGAEIMSQKFNIVAMLFFCVSRFVCTWFLKYISPSRLLQVLAVVAAGAIVGVILFSDRSGLYCLVVVSACMSLMFPTIYGISLRGVGDNVKFASAGLIMSVLGGSVFPPLQAAIIDTNVSLFGLPSTNLSFVIPLTCFIVVARYGYLSYVHHEIKGEE
ncbi:MAG: L-fucose:H+ symporter permease [Prevotella sp.]|nr:L-fucose:H+ symporter permease [Prevotella sp.]